MMPERLRPLAPRHGFSRWRTPRGVDETIHCWRSHDGLTVTSQLADMFLPGTQDTEIGPVWLIAVSHRGARPTDEHMARVVEAFAMPAFDEDNHYPGITRSLFCPIEESYRNACECKLTETVIVDDDGYTWTNPTDGGCRGCDLAAMQQVIRQPVTPCPIHQAVT
jgi:hypothetical protein